MKLDLKKAQEIAIKHLNSNYNVKGDVMVLLEDETIEKEYGWYFLSASRKFLETNDFSDMVLGNGAILVKKEEGNVIQFGTSQSVEYYIEQYEKEIQYKNY